MKFVVPIRNNRNLLKKNLAMVRLASGKAQLHLPPLQLGRNALVGLPAPIAALPGRSRREFDVGQTTAPRRVEYPEGQKTALAQRIPNFHRSIPVTRVQQFV